MSIVYQTERVSDLWEEATPLLQRHWDEIASFKDIPLNPDREAYAGLEATGQLRCYTARAACRLIGYVVFFFRTNLHYRDSHQAVQDVLFLLPEYRHGLTGVHLIRHAEQKLAEEGIQVVYHHAKRTNRLGELLARLGYELVEELYAKRLDGKGTR